jgi:hypothetical protein
MELRGDDSIRRRVWHIVRATLPLVQEDSLGLVLRLGVAER